MLKQIGESRGLTRRSFLATTAVVAGTISLTSMVACTAGDEGGTSVGEEEAAAKVAFSSCNGNCAMWGCPMNLHVKDGYVTNITKPNLKNPDGTPSKFQEICVKGYSNIERMYSESRVHYPMKRVGERGAGDWERISWDEAIEEITTTWKRLQDEHGPEAIAFSAGTGNNMISVDYVDRLKTLMGAMTVGNCYDQTGMYCQWEHVGFNPYTLGHNEHRDIQNADSIFVWGANPTDTFITDYHFISETQEKGVPVVVIDPNFTTTASKADMYVPIRPATDGLLAAGMAQIAMRDGKVDKKSLQTVSTGPFLVKDSDGLYLRLSDLGKAEAGSEDDRILVCENGEAVAFDAAQDPEIEGSFEIEGFAVKPAYQILKDRITEWDLDTISELTEIPLDTIEELAALYTSGNSMIVTGFGMDHYANGQSAYDGMCALADITGNIAKHGAGIACVDFTSPNPQGKVITAKAGLEDFVPGPTVYAPHFHELLQTGTCGTLTTAPKSIYVIECNPLNNMADRNNWLKSFDEMELIVVAEMFMSATAQYADIVLPVAFLFERDDLTCGNNPFVKIIEKAVEPQFEAKNDFEIVTLLGKGMGYDEYFTQTLEDFLSSCLTNDIADTYGVSWEKLKEEKAIWAYFEEPFVVGIQSPPLTKTGRMEFYKEGVQPQAAYAYAPEEWDMKKESCWYWEPPLEAWPDNPLREKYPYHLINRHSKYRTHSMFSDVPMLREIDPEPYVKINPDDAAAIGVAEGDTVRLYNDRGSVTIKVVLNPGARPGMFAIEHGWLPEQFIEGHNNELTSSATWKRHPQNNWSDCLVQIEKV